MNEGKMAIIWMIISTLALFILILGLRYLSNRENMALIEKGINPKQIVNRPAPYKNLKWALLLIGAGMGLFVAYILDFYILNTHYTTEVFNDRTFRHRDNDGAPALYFALIAIGGGLGLFGSYKMEKKWWDENKDSYVKN